MENPTKKWMIWGRKTMIFSKTVKQFNFPHSRHFMAFSPLQSFLQTYLRSPFFWHLVVMHLGCFLPGHDDPTTCCQSILQRKVRRINLFGKAFAEEVPYTSEWKAASDFTKRQSHLSSASIYVVHLHVFTIHPLTWRSARHSSIAYLIILHSVILLASRSIRKGEAGTLQDSRRNHTKYMFSVQYQNRLMLTTVSIHCITLALLCTPSLSPPSVRCPVKLWYSLIWQGI